MICFCLDRGFSAVVVRVRTFWECRKGGIRSDNLILSCRSWCLTLLAEKSDVEIVCCEAWFLVFFSDHIPRASLIVRSFWRYIIENELGTETRKRERK
jgi:hypothetical protein